MTKQEYLIDCFPELEQQITYFFDNSDNCHCSYCTSNWIAEHAFQYYTNNYLVSIRIYFDRIFSDHERNVVKSIGKITKNIDCLTNEEIIIFYKIYKKLVDFMDLYEN